MGLLRDILNIGKIKGAAERHRKAWLQAASELSSLHNAYTRYKEAAIKQEDWLADKVKKLETENEQLKKEVSVKTVSFDTYEKLAKEHVDLLNKCSTCKDSKPTPVKACSLKAKKPRYTFLWRED